MSSAADNQSAQAPGRIIAPVLVLLILSQLVYLYSDNAAAKAISIGLVALLPIVGWRFLRLREIYLLLICFLLLALTWFTGNSLFDFTTDGLSRSAFLASFILLMALLREGAITSPSVLEVGKYLTHQPPGRRFLTIFAGSHFFAVLINLGALSLLAPIIQRGVRANLSPDAPLDEIAQVRERRQLSATIRGFSWFLVWAPTAVTQAVMPTLMSGIDALRLMSLGFCLAVFMMGVSWLEDRLRWRGLRQRLLSEGRLPAVQSSAFPKIAMRNLGIVCLFLFGLSLTLAILFGVTLVVGVMLSVPLVVTGWVITQFAHESGGMISAPADDRLREITFVTLPGYVREAIFIACAGFIGTLAARLIPVEQMADAVQLSSQPGWLVLFALTFSVWFFGQVGLSPITMAIFLGSLVAELPQMPVDITLVALAIAAGTSVCTTGAPFSSGAVMLGRATGYTPYTLTWRWNGAYTIMAMAALALVYIFLTQCCALN